MLKRKSFSVGLLMALVLSLLAGAGVSHAQADRVPEPSEQATLQAEVMAQDGTVGSKNTAVTLGDLNLDGIPFSIADWVMMSVFGCMVNPGPWPPLDVQEQADTDCDGVVVIADLARLLPVLLGEQAPFDCPPGATSGTPRPRGYAKPTIASVAYVVEISDLLLTGIDTGWIEVVLLEAPEIMTGFQFNLEYDSDRLEFVDGVAGDHLVPHLFKHETATEPGKSCLRIVGQHCLPGVHCPGILALPDLPATLAKLKFRVITPGAGFETDLIFAWDYCHDNGISVGPAEWSCGLWPYYLAVSKEVYNSAGDNITGSNDRYGGAGDDCMVGGSRDIPIRQIDFHSGTLTYQPAEVCTITGDVNCSGVANMGDVFKVIDYFAGSHVLPACPHEMDANGDCIINYADFDLFVDCMMSPDYHCFPRETCCSPMIVFSCCVHGVGNVDGGLDNELTIGDVSAMIDMLYISGTEVACLFEADLNQSGGCNPTRADITIGDISILIDHLFITGPSLVLPDCLVCPPEGE